MDKRKNLLEQLHQLSMEMETAVSDLRRIDDSFEVDSLEEDIQGTTGKIQDYIDLLDESVTDEVTITERIF